MTDWKKEAKYFLPSKKHLIDKSDSPMEFWSELKSEFDSAVSVNDLDFVDKVLKLARSSYASGECSSAVCYCFYQQLAENESNWKHFPKWFVPSEFRELLQVFSYGLDKKTAAKLEKSFYK